MCQITNKPPTKGWEDARRPSPGQGGSQAIIILDEPLQDTSKIAKPQTHAQEQPQAASPPGPELVEARAPEQLVELPGVYQLLQLLAGEQLFQLLRRVTHAAIHRNETAVTDPHMDVAGAGHTLLMRDRLQQQIRRTPPHHLRRDPPQPLPLLTPRP